MTLLVLGATGALGRQIVLQALKRGYPVKCGVRELKKSAWLRRAGAELVYLDLRFPDTLPQVLKNVTVIFDASTLPADEELGTLRQIDLVSKIALIKAAKKANIQRFIFFSIANKPLNFNRIPLLNFKNSVETCLQNSGLPYTIFQLPSFFQGLIGQYAIPILDQETVWVTQDDTAISYLDTIDIAEMCVKTLTQEDEVNKTLVLKSSGDWSPSQIIGLCETYSGQMANINTLSPFLLEFSRIFASFFMWSWGIQDRLTFSNINNSEKNKTSSQHILYINKESQLDLYLQEYYSTMLKKLSDLKYDQSKVKQRKDLTF